MSSGRRKDSILGDKVQPNGRILGNKMCYNNANGSSAGRSTTVGNTTYYYNANGAPAGAATRTGW